MAVKPSTVMRANGLSLSANELGGTDPGDLVKAENVIIPAPGYVLCRPGQKPDAYALPANGHAGAIYDDTKIVQCGTDKLVYDSGAAYVEYDGDFTPPDADLIRMHFAIALLNLYFTTSQGVQRLDQVAGTPTLAGVQRPKDFFSAAVNATTGGFLGPGQSVAYRATLCRKDSHGNVVESAPNGMRVVTNTQALVAAHGTITFGSPSASSGTVGATIAGTTVTVMWGTSDAVSAAAFAAAVNANGTLAPNFIATALSNVITITCLAAGTAGNATTLVKQGTNVVASGATFTGGVDGDSLNVALSFPLGSGDYDTTMFYRLYRSVQFPGGETIPTETVQPPDVEYLIAERYLTTTQLSNALVSYVDTTPDEFLAVPLYTNGLSGNGESLSQANATPPWCRDACWWDDAMWYAGVKQRPAVTLQIVGTCDPTDPDRPTFAAGGGIRIGDQITIAGWTFTGGAAYDLTSLTFKVFTDSDDAAVNVEATARSLVNLINQNQTPPSYESSPILQAMYLGIPGQTYGTFLVEAQALDAEQFHVTLNTSLYTVATGFAGTTLGVVTAQTTVDNYFGDDDVVSVLSTNATDVGFDDISQPITVLGSATFEYLDVGAPAGNAHPLTVRRISPSPAGAWNPAIPPSFFEVAIGGLTRSGSTVTVHCDRAHGLRPGDIMPIGPATVADPNYAAGTYQVLATPTTTTYTYANAGTTVASLTAYQSGSRVLSDDSDQPHVALRSKTNLPEAVPVAGADNLWPIGVPGKYLYRLVPEKDFLYAFKEEGVYVASIGAPYRFTQIDSTAIIIAPDTAAVCRGHAYALTNQGVIECAPNGCIVVSGQIETDLLQYLGPSLDSVRVNAFAHVDETKGIYVLQMPALVNSDDETVRAARQYVYNLRARKWTTWELNRAWGTFRQSDNVMVVGGTDTKVHTSRNTQQARDYVDGETTVTATAWNSTTKVLTVTSASGLSVGDAVGTGIIAAIDGTALTMSGGTFVPLTAATGTVEVTFDINGASVLIAGVPCLANFHFDLRDTAVELTSSINAAPISVTATLRPAPSVIIDLVCDFLGTGGNTVLLSADFGTIVSGPTLTGGTGPGTYTAYARIPQAVKWRTLVAPSPANWQTGEFVHLHWRNRSFYKGTLILTTDQDPTGNTIDLYPSVYVDPDEGVPGTPKPYTVDLDYFPGQPREPVKSRRPFPDIGPAAYLNVEWELAEAFAVGVLNGLTLEIEAGSSESQYT